MERFYIVKKALVQRCCRGNDNHCFNKDKAFEAAKRLASQEHERYVVLESIAAFEPALDVVEVSIEDYEKVEVEVEEDEGED